MIKENILVYYVVPSPSSNKVTGFFVHVLHFFFAFLKISNHSHYSNFPSFHSFSNLSSLTTVTEGYIWTANSLAV